MNMLYYYISTFALLVIAVTMLARANDLRWRKGFKWNLRLFGFILAGTAPFGMIAGEFLSQSHPSFYEVLFRIGVMFVFVTTPYLPPWWKWISGKEEMYDDSGER
jgi:uncharacterized transporter YbjL